MADLLASFGIDWRLLIMQTVNFGVLLVLLTYFLYKPVLRILEERKKRIEQGIKDASDAKHKLENAEQESVAIIAEASSKADEIIVEAKDTAVSKEKEIIQSAEARSAKIESDAKARAEESAKKIIEESNKEMAKMAILASERLLNKKLN